MISSSIDISKNMEITDTLDNGESLVHIAKLGTVVGSDKDGNAVEQNFTEEALQKIADEVNNSGVEKLVDKDHQSLRPALEKNTEAMGFMSELKVEAGKGLFGKIKWTDIGKKLIENRVFRWLSPVFRLNKETKEPIELVNVALTNMPSQPDLDPIVNAAPDQITLEKEIIKMEITKEDLVQLIKDTIKAVEVEEETKEEVTEVPVENEEPVKDEEEVKTGEQAVEETKTETPKEEEPVKNEEVVDAPKAQDSKAKDEEEEKEVIKLEAINTAPSTSIADISGKSGWENLKGKAFFDYVSKHPGLR